jgi:hypothetical protein
VEPAPDLDPPFGSRPRRVELTSNADVLFINQRTFKVPVRIEPGRGKRLKQVLLYCSTDQGQSWREVGTIPPSADAFSFRVPRDGIYRFAVQTEDTDGRRSPASLDTLPPALVVCVDTQAPQAALKLGPGRSGILVVEWEVRDDNLDPRSVTLEYRPVGEETWRRVPVDVTARGVYDWNAPVKPLEVRLRAKDLAGNHTEARAHGQAAP